MNLFIILIAVLGGFVLGFGAAFVLRIIQAKTGKELADELFRESEARRMENVGAILENLKDSFGKLSLEALSRSTEEFLKLARERLESERQLGSKELDAKKGLIDQQLQRMTQELENVGALMKELEKDRVEKFGELASQLKTTGEQTLALTQVTNTLREALASSKARGQWGERMAEDILKVAGFIENINYLKQKAIEGSGARPDFTFLLPRDLKLNMDVKFPFDNYLRYLEAGSESEKEKARKDFLRDIKSRIKDVSTRDYINPEQNTVDCVLLFIPNEQIYEFIHMENHSIIEEALKQKVIFCSPITLFAILAIVRQATENFAFQQASNEIITLLSSFRKQWAEFIKALGEIGKKIGDAQTAYEKLMTTRKHQLEKPLDKIEQLRTQRNLPEAVDEDKNPP